MGVIVNYTCKHCGFVADEVFVGPGWATTQETFLCKDCGNVSSAPIDERTSTILPKYSHCNKCNGTNLVPWNGKCPRCGSTDIDEEAVGMWD